MALAFKVEQRAETDRRSADWRGRATSRIIQPPSASRSTAACPEIDCLRGILCETSLRAARRRADSIGTGADRVLITSGAITEYEYVRRLARAAGVAFDTLDDCPRDFCPVSDDALLDASIGGTLWLDAGDTTFLVIAPRGLGARHIVEFLRQYPSERARVVLTTSYHLQRFIERHTHAAWGERATHALQRTYPHLSAAPPRWRRSLIPASFAGITALIALVIAPGKTMLVFEIMLASIFLSWMVLRIAGTLMKSRTSPTRTRLSDADLPVYTVMVALYREAASVGALVAALRQLDYPSEKLDIKIVVEPDDLETQQALARLKLGAPFEMVVVPDYGPRTKPKALNAALALARGQFVAVYDAEDRPEPNQLRRALEAFAVDDLACVQAALTIDNTYDSWLTALFTAEYAGQFDVFLPALAALKLPLPLGGSSNHFNAHVLRAVGAWDAFNVTEDADLGMRLARCGYRTGVIDSTTYEEAPARFGPWLRQRTRWFKGWMQTWLVHMRAPRRLREELGLPAFIALQLMVGGNVLAALVHPVFIALLFGVWLSGATLWDSTGTAALFSVTIAAGYFASAILGIVGLFRRGLMASAWSLLFIPVHWLLLSAAAWRALYQLIFKPYLWEKTDHGLARTSRLNDDPSHEEIARLLRALRLHMHVAE